MKTGVVLMAHGTPDSLDDMEAYLLRVMRGRVAKPEFVAEIKRRYSLIGGRSPLTDITRAQAEALSKRLGLPVAVGTLHWTPTIAEAVASLKVDRIVGIVAAPHCAPITTNHYRQALPEGAAFIESWHLQPSFIEAWANRVRGAEFVLFTAHSVPIETAGTYPAQLQETVKAIAAKAGLAKFDFAYQSRSPSPIPWLEPDVEAKIDELHANDVERFLVAPIGFVSDNVEILYDLDRLHAEHAYRLRLKWSRAPMLNDDPLLIEALTSAISGRLQATR